MQGLMRGADKKFICLLYEGNGHLLRQLDGLGEGAEYGYNLLGERIHIRTTGGSSQRYELDALGGKEEYVYDEEGRLKEKRDRNGITTEYGYTLYGAPLYRRVKGSEEGDFYRYTPEGLLRSALSQRREGSMCYRYGYDGMDRLLEKSASGRTLLAYGYDGNGNRIRQRDVTGKVTEYVYDVCDRLTEVWEEGRKLASYTYGADGRIREESHGPMRKEYAYDGQKNLTGLTLWSGDRLLTDNQYRYDGNGNCIVKKQLSGETRYSFDRLNQLKRVDYPAYSEELFYDKAGNRTRRLVEGAEERYGYDAGNRLTGYTRKGVTISFVYDGAGNLLRDNRAEYSYDGFNRTVRVETFDGHIQVNRYDAEGLRHELEENGKLVQFIFNPEKQVVTETGAEKIRYIRGRELIASDAESARTYYHYASNELGSITHLLDESGAILNRYEYDAWGNLVECEERVVNRFAFAGEQLDPLTQQYYLRARYYNPVMARFTQEDSYRGDGLNLYTYCRNNPVYYVDPSGHQSQCIKDAAEKAIAEGASAEEAYRNAYKKHTEDKLSDSSNLSAREKYKLEERAKRLGIDPAENREKAPEAETPQSESGRNTTSTQLSRRELAEIKLADAANGSRAEGVLIGKDGDVPVYQSQQQFKKSIMDAGAQYIGPTRNNDGQIYHMNTPYGPVEIRIMQQKPGQTNLYLDNRTIIVEQGSVGNGTGVYTYGNGAPIRGSVSRSDRKAIGHTHGQTP